MIRATSLALPEMTSSTGNKRTAIAATAIPLMDCGHELETADANL
jgi:hypothetical protein